MVSARSCFRDVAHAGSWLLAPGYKEGKHNSCSIISKEDFRTLRSLVVLLVSGSTMGTRASTAVHIITVIFSGASMKKTATSCECHHSKGWARECTVFFNISVMLCRPSYHCALSWGAPDQGAEACTRLHGCGGVVMLRAGPAQQYVNIV